MPGLVPRTNTLFLNKRKQTTFDFLFMDRIIREGFYVGGTDLLVYKTLGTYDQFKNIVSSSNPEQVFSAGSEFSNRYVVEKAFDGRDESYYQSLNVPTGDDSEFILIDLGADKTECPKVVNGFSIQAALKGSSPISLEMQGSMNATTWASIVTVQLSDDENVQKFSVDNTDKYRYYRFVPRATTHESIPWTVVELELYSEAGEENNCTIQDTFFVENRDRIYDQAGCALLCHYEIPEKPHDLTKFGFFISADQIEITTLRSDSISRIGRVIGPGDIIALPHVSDDSHDEGGEIDVPWIIDPKTPNQLDGRRYEVIDSSKAASGWDPRWRDHLTRLICVPLKDGAQTLDVTGGPGDVPSASTEVRTRDILKDISDGMHDEAAMAGELGQDLRSIGYPSDQRDWTGAYTMDAIPPNDEPYTEGLDFPAGAAGDWFRHTGWDPVKLYRHNGNRWIRFETESRKHFDARFTHRGHHKDTLDLPTEGASSIQQTLEDKS